MIRKSDSLGSSDGAQPVTQQDKDRRAINSLNSDNIDGGPEGHTGPTSRVYFYGGRGGDHNYFDDVNVQNGQLISNVKDRYNVLGYDIARSLEVAMKYTNGREEYTGNSYGNKDLAVRYIGPKDLYTANTVWCQAERSGFYYPCEYKSDS